MDLWWGCNTNEYFIKPDFPCIFFFYQMYFFLTENPRHLPSCLSYVCDTQNIKNVLQQRDTVLQCVGGKLINFINQVRKWSKEAVNDSEVVEKRHLVYFFPNRQLALCILFKWTFQICRKRKHFRYLSVHLGLKHRQTAFPEQRGASPRCLPEHRRNICFHDHRLVIVV